MPPTFDSGYGKQPYRDLCENFPDSSMYPQADFRVEWGPIFHRGRLDGSARVLLIGQDPAAQEAIARRILVGTAGHRVQGFLHKLGIDLSYVMINTFLYSVYGSGGQGHKNDPGIVDYRNRWLKELLRRNQIEAIVAFGGLADDAWQKWWASPAASGSNPVYAHVTHPTAPESAGGSAQDIARTTRALLRNWNNALDVLHPAIAHPDTSRPLVRYGQAFKPHELKDIPPDDLPPGLPSWMQRAEGWARRTGNTAAQKRATITVTVPGSFVP